MGTTDWRVPLFKIYWDSDDVDSVREAVEAGRDWAIGPNVERFERQLAEYVGAPHALSFNSGTSALHALMIAHGIGPGDEVIVPSFTFISTANAPLFVGARPVFADIEEQTRGLDPSDVRSRITDSTKVVMPVHYGGCPCRIEELRQVADEHGLLLVEDAAESLGATLEGRHTGTFGDTGMYSLCGPKVITSGEGGAVVTASRDIFEHLRLIRSHGRREATSYFDTPDRQEYVEVGYNFRMSNITAALAVTQLQKIEKMISMRREKAGIYDARLAGIEGLRTGSEPAGSRHVYQMYTVEVTDGGDVRDRLASHLNSEGIMTKNYFEPVHRTVLFKEKLAYDTDLPVTEAVSSRVLTLPMYPGLSEGEIDFICSKVRDFFGVDA
ncbi:MAG: DegT/DnrJ/EryC1/StrS family aminotransferase [Actinobacteria bacterium]|nr:DegT/DnrJ/EryC1/StrS family aminotransferase [Actinomycetota bacterium]MBU1942460.1 DegT/DnrJ/EryC1/StrS family aminotransferase [Actinomycetota bacterium]MBU2686332.1 DegT/DnrJ/EryC1/StrS family aminotransferase [Actinomycetota bacterium]